MRGCQRNSVAGRTSCWVLGGLGCLGLMVLAVGFVFLMMRGLQQSGVGQAIRTAAESEQRLKPRLAAIAQAIEEYARENNGRYPPSLKALVPKYLPETALAPVVLEDGTKYEFVYRPPKPDDPPDTVMLEHQPPVKVTFSIMGETAETQTTYQVGKDGRIRERVETVSSSGRRLSPQRGTSPP